MLKGEPKIEAEIARLEESPMVALALAEERYREARRQYLQSLRTLERKGRRLAADGVTVVELEA